MTTQEWYKHAFHIVKQPLAFLDHDNKYIHVNREFERLVGYSSTELTNMTWMQITVDEDIGGDLRSIEAVKKGDIPSYTLLKRFRRKDGKIVPVAATVWRYPPGGGELVGFTVEVISKDKDVNEVLHKQMEMVKKLEQRIDDLEQFHKVVDQARKMILKWLPIFVAVGGTIGWLVSFILQWRITK